MEQCKYNNEIGRVIRLLDGNGKGGLVEDMVEVKSKLGSMETDIQSLLETSKAQSTSISAFNKYQAAQEVLNDYKQRLKREKRQIIFFVAAQSITMVGLVIAMILKVL